LRRIFRFLGVAIIVILVIGVAGYGAAYLSTSRSTVARALVWRDADVMDYRRFPARPIPRGRKTFRYPTAARERRFGALAIPGVGERDLYDFLLQTQTTAFLIVHKDRLVFERYLNGSGRTSIQTSFSVAKSFVSAMVGAAIEQGHIKSVDDRVTKYIPELAARDERFRRIRLRHLLTMSSGLRYQEEGLPWSDDAKTYYGTNLRALAIRESQIVQRPGKVFHYNNYNPLLLGIVLERATGMPVSSYLSKTIWQPLGMQWDGTWSLDSQGSGFEKMESGINARALDFAKLGSLYLHRGRWLGERVIPSSWVEATTRVESTTDASKDYGYFWWTDRRKGESYFSARGNRGQFVFVFPERDLVIARFGRDFGYELWPELFWRLARRFPASG
jgi:CubicO group peptidase (beta-lactamase class C family)